MRLAELVYHCLVSAENRSGFFKFPVRRVRHSLATALNSKLEAEVNFVNAG